MKEIKYKAWNKEENRWATHNEQLSEVSVNASVLTPSVLTVGEDKYELVLYTTHSDENGIEIYNGDIIQYEYTEDSCWGEPGIYTGHIRFDEGIFEVVHHREPIRRYPDGTWRELSEADDLKSFMRWAEEVKVIGNIYEHPHLIGGVK